MPVQPDLRESDERLHEHWESFMKQLSMTDAFMLAAETDKQIQEILAAYGLTPKQ